MKKQPASPEKRERHAQDKKEKHHADALAEDNAVDRMIRESIEKHGP